MSQVLIIQFYRLLKLSCFEGSWYKLNEKMLICAPPELFFWPPVLFISALIFPMDISSTHFSAGYNFFVNFASNLHA